MSDEPNKPVSESIMDAVDVGDIPMPAAVEDTGIADAFGYPTAFKFAFAGIGQGGSRICEAFHELGYRRTCVINTTEKDMAHIKVPESSKLVISGERASLDGAGKDPSVAEAAMAGKTEEVYDLFKRCWGEKYDWSFICLGAGGGTGAGASAKATDIAKKLMADLKLEQRVGAIVALPKNDEGHRVAGNAIETIRQLDRLGLSPIIIIDNERIKQIYPKTPVGQFWAVANKGICTLLHLFNRIAAQPSQHTAFDPADFTTMLASGVVAFGATSIANFQNQADISKAIRQQLQANILASIDLTKGKRAGCIFVGSQEILGSLPQEFLDHGFEMLSRILAPGSTVHRGIYTGTNKDLRVYTMIGELPLPVARLNELSCLAGKNSDYAGG